MPGTKPSLLPGVLNQIDLQDNDPMKGKRGFSMVAEENYFSGSEHGEYALVLDGNKEIFGAGSLAEVGAHGRVLGMTRVALFTDARLAKLPAVETAVKSLRDKGIKVTVFDGVEIEPSDRSLKAALRFAESDTFDGFVSVGGGSVQDTVSPG